MKRQIYRVLINTLAFFAAAQFLPIKAATPGYFLAAGIMLSLINRLIRPVLIILTLPLNLLTMGFFTLVINAWMIMLTGELLPGFHIPGFKEAFIVSLIVSLANWGFKNITGRQWE